MISKELLSEVLGCDCIECYFEDTYNKINYRYQYDVTWSEQIQTEKSDINIHELAHKCKEWARNEDYQIHSWLVIKSGGYSELISRWDDGSFISPAFQADTEPEAIFKACQWILATKEP